ncbi:MAG: transcriptional regulator [Clostridia bacterium]|jgi:DNA-binding PucR family transcriptional regulator|nr:transcriptional regulator [Clostridia bacterium]
MENPEYMDWLKGNELILTTGMFMDKNNQKLLSFIENLYEQDAAGLIINLSPYIKKIPDEVIRLGDFLGFPIFEMAPEIRIIDVSEAICTAIIESGAKQNMTEHFLFSLIYDKVTITDKVLRKAVSCGYIPDQVYQTIIFSVTSHNTSNEDEVSIDDDVNAKLIKTLESQLKILYNDTSQDFLFFSHNNQITLLYPVTPEDPILQKIEQFIAAFEKRYKKYRLHAGVSSRWQQLTDFRSHYDKAQNALKFIGLTGKDSKVIQYDDLDIFCLLLSISKPSELSALYRRTLEKLMTYDQTAHSDLILTLEKFIEENGNLSSTANLLFIHVNTLRYRLKKIEQLLSCDLKNADTIFQLNLSLKIKKYVEYIEA